jgi:prohibitin 2
LNQREQVSFSIRKSLEERAKDFFILLDDVSITHLEFSAEFHQAVEEKQAAQQEAEKAKFYVEQALQDKKSTIIKAQGEAISAELIGKSMNPAYIELKRIEAARKIAETLSTSRNRAFIDAETLLLNLTGPLNHKLSLLGDPNKV